MGKCGPAAIQPWQRSEYIKRATPLPHHLARGPGARRGPCLVIPEDTRQMTTSVAEVFAIYTTLIGGVGFSNEFLLS